MQSDILILYGSETGTAESLAHHISYQLSIRNLNAPYMSLQDYPINQLPNQKYVVFIVSTTNQGDPPRNMVSFYQTLLLKHLPNTILKNINFSIFGCGDSGYKQFNAAARKLYQRLLQLGAQLWFERGLGDDKDRLGVYQEFLKWKENLFKALYNIFPDNLLLQEINDIKGLNTTNFSIKKIDKYIFEDSLNTFKVSEIDQVTPEGWEFQTLKISFDTQQQYQPGFIASIFPENDIQLINQISQLQDYQLHAFIEIQNKNNVVFKGPIENFLKKYINLSYPPNQQGIRILSEFAQDQQHKEKLLEMSSLNKEGLELYYEYVSREQRNICEILYDFSSVKIPLEFLIEVVGNLHNKRIYQTQRIFDKFIIKIIKIRNISLYKKNQYTFWQKNHWSLFKIFLKIKSRRLSQIKYQKRVFKLSKRSKVLKQYRIPVILVGPGTGIAPLMSFIKDRFDVTQKQNDYNNTLIIFGCKNSSKDFYYQDYLQNLANQNKIQIITAFSRDQDYKVYVQHKIKEHGKLIFDMINDNLSQIQIFVCGQSKFMPGQVEDAFKEVMGCFYNDKEKGIQVIQNMILNKQYQLESW